MRGAYFLPKYSSLYVKCKDEIRFFWGCALFLHFIFMGLSLFVKLLKEEMYEAAALGLAVYVVLAGYYGFIQPRIVKWKRGYGMSLGADGVLRMTPWGTAEMLSYEIYEEAIRRGQYYYGKEGLILGKGKYRLRFPYETEDSLARENVLNCHKKLQEHVTEKVPPLYLELQEAYRELIENRIAIKSGVIFLPVLMLGVNFLGSSDDRGIFNYLFWAAFCLMDTVFIWLNFSGAEICRKQYKYIRFFLKYMGIRAKPGRSLGLYVWAVVSMVFLLWHNCRMVLLN